jgi:hypothetical protein
VISREPRLSPSHSWPKIRARPPSIRTAVVVSTLSGSKILIWPTRIETVVTCCSPAFKLAKSTARRSKVAEPMVKS